MLKHLFCVNVRISMAIKIYSQSEQAYGQFDNGAIKENKPLGFPHEGGDLKPFSSLFYWAHAWSEKGGLIGEHPHQGFEIMSFVLKGTIEHYDSQLKGWKRLEAGDVQIIRSGNGIYHAERFLPDTHIFQIWLDPNLGKTLNQPASYDDYRNEAFPTLGDDSFKVKLVKGQNAPLQMEANIQSIKEIDAKKGSHELALEIDNVFGIYLIDGKVNVDGNSLDENSFVIVKEEAMLKLEVLEDAKLFILELPKEAGYQTYADLQGISAPI